MTKHWKLFIALGACALAALSLLGYLIWSGYQQAIEAAEITTSNYAAIMEARLDATLRRADSDLRELVQEIPVAALSKQAEPRYARELNQDLRAHMVNFPELTGIRVTDANGERLYTSDGAGTPRTQLGDRGYFRQLRDNPGIDLVFSEVITTRLHGRPSVVIGKALRDGQGAFRGVVFAVIELSHFQKLFESLNIGANGIVAFYRSDDFSQVVRWPPVDEKLNTQLPLDSLTRKALVPGKTTATLAFTSRRDGIARIYSYHVLDRYPFFVAVGFAREHVLASWRARSLAVGLSGLLLLGLLAGLMFRLWRAEARRGHATAALVQSEKRFRVLFDRAGDGIMVVSPNGKLIASNESFARMHGYTVEEMQTLSLENIDTPETRKLIAERMQRILSGEALTFEAEHFHKDGHVFPLEVSASLISSDDQPVVQAFHRDITERKQGEMALKKSEEKYRALVETTGTGYLILDMEGKVVDANAEYVRLTGHRELQDLLGKPVTEWTAGYEKERNSMAVAQCARDGFIRDLVIDYVDGSGRITHIEINATVVADGDALRIISLCRDITERKRVEAARAQLEEQLRESQKMEAIGTLAGGVAHDFNNILATILGNVELTRQDVSTNSRALESLEEIRKAGARARSLVQQILSFSRRQPTERKVMALAPIVEESARLLRATLPARLAIEVHCDTDVPVVLGDVTQIQQVLINLVTNAMQAISSGPGRIEIRLDAVMLDEALADTNPALRAMRQKHAGRTARLAVSDNGRGMDAVTLGRIFEPFFTTKPVNEGTGLGLSVVHGIVQAHDGAIVVDSAPGKGTIFTLYLPAAETQAGAPTPDQGKSTAATAPALSLDGGQHILYIDDDESLVFLVQRLLERRGFRISGYVDQTKALDALRADPTAFNLVVSDYNMPSMSGLDVARAVRAIRADLPVAVASGFIDEALRAEAGEAGVRELIFKADAAEDLCEAFARLAQTVGKA